MSTEGTKASIADPRPSDAIEEASESATSQRIGEGLGVFRALILTALFYLALGSLLWGLWQAIAYWRGR